MRQAAERGVGSAGVCVSVCVCLLLFLSVCVCRLFVNCVKQRRGVLGLQVCVCVYSFCYMCVCRLFVSSYLCSDYERKHTADMISKTNKSSRRYTRSGCVCSRVWELVEG